MAWSRTYLQVHWLLDVVAGSLLGAGVALVVFAALQLLLGETRRTRSVNAPAARDQPPGARVQSAPVFRRNAAIAAPRVGKKCSGSMVRVSS